MRTIILFLALTTIMFVGCSKEETSTQNPTTSTLKLNISGLEDLGANARYEGWLIVPTTSNTDAPSEEKDVSTGVFTANATGVTGVNNLVDQFELNQNYPNPFNPSTNIRYRLPIRS